MRKRSVAMLALAFTLSLAACSPSTTTPATPASPTQTVAPEAASAVEAAMQDAAAHLGVTSDQLQVTQVDSRDWGDASLGCPQPGQLYSQVVTPGFLITITSGSRQLEYHADTRAHVKLCRES